MSGLRREPRLNAGDVRRAIGDTLAGFASFALTEATDPQAQTEAGRLCARLALKRAGSASTRLRRDTIGAPTWPHGYTGSITHGGGVALAVALATAHGLGIGIDLEPMRSEFPPRAVDLCFPGYQGAQLAGMPPNTRRTMAYAAFSASEALVKLRHTATGRHPDEAEIDALVDAILASRQMGPRRLTRLRDRTVIWTHLARQFVLTVALSAPATPAS